jgi:hypothetical protein
LASSISAPLELALCIDQSEDGLARGHANPVENVIGVPLLRQIEAILGASYIDAEEEAKLAHVLHGELGADTVHDVLE